MAGIIQFLEKAGNGLNRFMVIMACVAVMGAVAAVWWLIGAVGDSSLSVGPDDAIDSTPTMVERMQNIGEWEFLAVSDEEIVDTVRKGFFSDDELVRIYYGTLRLGIDLRECSDKWVSHRNDTVFVTVPQVKLLDYNFIDEARTRPFFETGTWTPADRKAMYHKARRIMIERCMNRENIAVAQNNAREQIARMLQPIAAPKVVTVLSAAEAE